eukprot:CAMPEP_0194217746 /NCGR_PEP_ID=MMETSP0156-20130528/22199_1 /TAXON_ID=33649 /ORGANISM="Thalassionema nitzschioides, Strain L26-B" /LENGTH=31 /DNA_ID= /DNA_START= /DNA_END= /DNA_ORIENTATION=
MEDYDLIVVEGDFDYDDDDDGDSSSLLGSKV